MLGIPVVTIPGSGSTRSWVLDGYSCRGSSIPCLWLLAAGALADTWDAQVLDTTHLGVVCFLLPTIPELPLGLRVASAVTCRSVITIIL